MKIWSMEDPGNDLFSDASRRGTWKSEPGAEDLCPACNGTRQRLVSPLIIEWRRKPRNIGDFTWVGAGASEIVVSDRAWSHLSSHYRGLSIGPVHIVSKKIVSISELKHLLLPEQLIPIDEKRSTVVRELNCNFCGRERYKISGIEDIAIKWNKATQTGLRVRTARNPHGGIFIREQELNGHTIFRVKERPNWALCTDDARLDIEQAGFTNITFMEVGTLF